MSFLSALGKILAVGEEVAGVFFPVLRPFLGSGKAAQTVTIGVNDFTQIASVIVGVEAAFQGPGSAADKLKAALPQVANIVRTSEALIGHKVYNEPEFIAGNSDLVNALVRILNSYGDNEIKSSGQPIDTSKSAALAAPTPIKTDAPVRTVSPLVLVEDEPVKTYDLPAPTTSPQPTTTGVHPLALTE